MKTFTSNAATTGVISNNWSPDELATNDFEDDQTEVEYEDAIASFAAEFELTKDEAWELHYSINDGEANIGALYEHIETHNELGVAA